VRLRGLPKARKFAERMRLYADGHILRIRIWEVAEPVPPSVHRLKYSLFYGQPGARVVLYDNERGKGDHRHYGEVEETYEFQGIERLIADFLADVRRLRGGEQG
jgi:hypothetical protein